MRYTIFILTFITVSLSLQSCERDEIVSPPSVFFPTSGAYILSEGTFTPGTSRLSYYDRTNDSFYVSIFNPGNLGNAPDGMLINSGNLYITEQGNFGAAGKIYRTDTNGTVITSNNVGINPYSIAFANAKIYVTNGPANNVSVLDKSTLALLNTISTGLYPQEIIASGSKVFVANTSVFGGGTDSTVTVIDSQTDLVTATIILKKFATSLAVLPDGKVLAGCPGDSSTAAIYKIDPVSYEVIDSFKNLKNGFSRDIAVVSSNRILFIGGDIYSEGTIESYDLNTRVSVTLIAKPLNELNYSLTYDSEPQYIYVGVAASNFTSAGKFRIYNISGSLRNEFPISNSSVSGIGPRRIVIKN